MKKLGVVVSLLVGLAGCGDTEAETVPSAETGREISIFSSDGWTYFTQYTYYPATHRLQGHWSRHGPDGRRTNDAERQLTDEGAHALEARLSAIRLDTTKPSGNCGADMPTLTLEYVEISGESRTYHTDPEYNSCEASRVFVRKDDAQAALDTCQGLLPPPEM
jgi:hypothetical protein